MDELEVLLRLTDQMSGPARAVNSELGALERSITSAQSSLGGLGAGLSVTGSQAQALNVNANPVSASAVPDANAAAAALQRAAQAEQKLADAAKQASASLGKQSQQAQKSGPKLDGDLKSSLEGGINSVNAIAGPLGGITGRANQALSAISKLGPYGAAAAAVVVAALASVVVSIKLVTAAFEAAFSARDAALKMQGALAAISLESGKATLSIKEVSSAVSSVAADSALGADKIGEYATQLAKVGVQGDKLKIALKTMTEAGSAGGDAQAQAFLKAAQAAGTNGKALDDLIAKTHDAFGATAQAQALSFGNQLTKFKSSIGDLFSGANLEPFLSALSSVTSMFSQNTVTGRALKQILSAALEGFANTAKAVFPYVRSAIQNVIIYALKLGIAWRQFSKSDVGKGLITGLTLAAKGAGIVVAAFWTLQAAGLAVAGVLAAIFVAPIVAIVAGIGWLIENFTRIPEMIGGAITSAIAWLDTLGSSAYAAAGNLIQGLVNGIASGAGMVIDAIRNLGASAMGALKSILGISSPSKVFAQYGGHTAEGFAQGVDAKGDVVEKSMDGMVDVKPGGKKGGKGKISSGGPVSIVFNLYAAMGADERERAREMILDIFESEALA